MSTNEHGPAHLCPQPAHGLAFDERGVLRPVGRESVADALLIVKSYGPWGADLNDAHRRQIVLAEALEEALFVLGMVDKNNRINAGENGKAWAGRFVVEEVRRVLTLGPRAEQRHGVNCEKAPHNGGNLHSENDNTPFEVDGVSYCGRCHKAL